MTHDPRAMQVLAEQDLLGNAHASQQLSSPSELDCPTTTDGMERLANTYKQSNTCEREQMQRQMYRCLPWQRDMDRNINDTLPPNTRSLLPFKIDTSRQDGQVLTPEGEWHELGTSPCGHPNRAIFPGDEELGPFSERNELPLQVMTEGTSGGTETSEMTPAQARHHAAIHGSTSIRRNGGVCQLKMQPSSEDGYALNEFIPKPETAAAVKAADPSISSGSFWVPGSNNAEILAGIRKRSNRQTVSDMVNDGVSPGVSKHCRRDELQQDTLWMAESLFQAGAGEASGGNFANKITLGHEVREVVTNLTGVNNEGNLRPSIPTFASAEEIAATAPKGVYKRCIDSYDPDGIQHRAHADQRRRQQTMDAQSGQNDNALPAIQNLRRREPSGPQGGSGGGR